MNVHYIVRVNVKFVFPIKVRQIDLVLKPHFLGNCLHRCLHRELLLIDLYPLFGKPQIQAFSLQTLQALHEETSYSLLDHSTILK